MHMIGIYNDVADIVILVFPCAVLLEGEYGYHDTVNGVPVVLGANGIEEIVELPLNLNEQHQFAKSVESVNRLLSVLRNDFFTKEVK